MSEKNQINNNSTEFIVDHFRFGKLELRLKRIRDLDDLIDQITDDEFNTDERIPYWAEVWPSAFALAHYVQKHPEQIRNRIVLELGCGLGLTSLMIQLQEPADFLCTDYEQGALDLAAVNFRLNDIPPPAFALLDWRDVRFEETYECIIASDVAYEERFFQPLICLFRKLLRPGGTIILAEPNRVIARPFFRQLEENGFIFGSTCETVLQDGKKVAVAIYTIKKKA